MQKAYINRRRATVNHGKNVQFGHGFYVFRLPALAQKLYVIKEPDHKRVNFKMEQQ
jgi:hypothetical protein